MMPNRTVIYPFLFILYIILNPLLNNLDQIDPSQAVRPLAVLVLAAGAAMFLLYALFKDWHYAGHLVFLVLVFIFVFGHLSRVLQNWLPIHEEPQRLVLLAGWGALLAFLGSRRLWARFGGSGRLTPLLNLILILAILSQLFTALPHIVQASPPVPEQEGESHLPGTGEPLALDCSDRPDIYYIVLDGYGREDVLARQYGVDTSDFIATLQRKGFTVASQSHANYIQTIYSIASSLNFSYIEPEPEGVSGQDYFTQRIAENQIMQALKQCGYQTIAFETGFYFTDHPQVDLFLSSSDAWLSEFESLLLAGTPLEMLVEELEREPPALSYDAHRRRVRYTFNQLQRLPRRPGPKFVFAHIISPHPPFVLDERGRAIEPERSYSIGDGDDFEGSWEEYREGYAGQVQYVNRMLEKTVDAILARSRRPPVIILQGDHGPGGSLDWSSPERTCLWERSAILNAYYLPDGAASLPADITPVNSFRLVLNAYFGAGLELLPDRSYFTSHRLEREMIDITAERDSAQGCALP